MHNRSFRELAWKVFFLHNFQEIEAVEEAWRCETRELVTMVSRLQTENQRLSQETKGKSSSTEALNFDPGLVQKLEEQVVKQRNEIKQKNSELQEKIEFFEHFAVEMEQQKNQNSEIKKRSKSLQNQIKTLCEERADFLAKIQDQHREMTALKKKLGIAEKENEDLEKDESTTPRFTIAELKEVLAERNELKNRVNDLEEELMAFKPLSASAKEERPVSEGEEDAPVQGNLNYFFLIACSLLMALIKNNYAFQGPLPEEWYNDDLWKKKNSESGIRKL